MADLTGWAATFIMIVGNIFLVKKHVAGMWLMLLGNLCWLVVGCLGGLTSLISASIIFGLLNIWCIVVWSKP